VRADGDNRDEDRWKLEGPATKIDIDEIPFVTFYADREDLMFGKPPLEDLADVNIEHWQSSSDQRNILTVARFPMLALSGGDEQDSTVEIGPRRMLYSPDSQAKFYYVEHTGAAIEAGRKDLMDLEEKMSHYGAQFTRRRPSIESATARVLNDAESTSALEDAAVRFNDALENVIRLLGMWMDVEPEGTVKINTDLDSDNSSPTVQQSLQQARAGKDLSRENYLKALKRHDVLENDFDIKENDRQLAAERAAEPDPKPQPQSQSQPQPQPEVGDGE
jgi:hypothetical protein